MLLSRTDEREFCWARLFGREGGRCRGATLSQVLTVNSCTIASIGRRFVFRHSTRSMPESGIGSGLWQPERLTGYWQLTTAVRQGTRLMHATTSTPHRRLMFQINIFRRWPVEGRIFSALSHRDATERRSVTYVPLSDNWSNKYVNRCECAFSN